MPQMAPLNWLFLMIFFTLVFLSFNSINYFTFMYTPKKSEQKSKKLKFNWKW